MSERKEDSMPCHKSAYKRRKAKKGEKMKRTGHRENNLLHAVICAPHADQNEKEVEC